MEWNLDEAIAGSMRTFIYIFPIAILFTVLLVLYKSWYMHKKEHKQLVYLEKKKEQIQH